MTPALIAVLALAAWLALSPTRGPGRRLRLRLALPTGEAAPEHTGAPGGGAAWDQLSSADLSRGAPGRAPGRSAVGFR